MAELPSGTVTLLFSDIEGSTSLVRALGDGWAGVLQQQRDLCRAAWAAHGGHELGTEGDSFFVVFASVIDAVAAAVAAQRAIAAAVWPEDGRVKIRIGIHTGSPQRHAEGYVGMDVHRAARVAAAAHGGQIIVTDPTAGLVREHLPAEVALRDCGEHGLKDIPTKTHLHQVETPGLESAFPPLRTLGGAGSLPTVLTPTVGRDGERAELCDLLRTGVRLVTLTGPGGTGKTRLGTAVAADLAEFYPDGVHFVPLATVTAAADMWAAIGTVLDVPADGQVPPGFFDHVRERRVLLVLDNLEQIADADTTVRTLMHEAPHITVVATSRRPLHVEGEHDHQVPSLLSDGAVAMFADHAARARRGFQITDANQTDVEALCEALDRLPLALELAAARVKLLTPAAILKRLDTALDLASSDRSRDTRQATLRGAIDWSYQLLTPPQQAVLDHLGVFEGAVELEAVEAAVPDELLAGAELVDVLFDLVDASLVRIGEDENGEPRFYLLETVKAYARDRLRAQDKWGTATRAHAQHYYDQAIREAHGHEAGKPGLHTWFTATADELRAILDRGAGGITDPEHYASGPVPAQHVAALLCWIAWTIERRAILEGWVETALRMPDHDPAAEATLRWIQLVVLRNQRDTLRSATMLDTALDLIPASTQAPRVPWLDPALSEGELVLEAIWLFAEQGEFERARRYLDRTSRCDPTDTPLAMAKYAGARAALAYFEKDWDTARVHNVEMIALRADTTNASIFNRVSDANNLYCIDVAQHRHAAACRGLADLVESVLADDQNPMDWLWPLETHAAALTPFHPEIAAQALGLATQIRVVEGMPLDRRAQRNIDDLNAQLRTRLGEPTWIEATERGRTEHMFDLLREMAALPIPGDEVSDG